MKAPAGSPGWTRGTWVLRLSLLVLPVAALLVALPVRPHAWVLILVVAGSLRWALLPDDLVGALVLLLVAGWWALHGATDWRLGAVGLLLFLAHVAATLASYGPGTSGPSPALVRLWGRRVLLSLAPLVAALAAVRLLDPGLAPPWLWSGALATTAVLVLVASRMTHRVES